jgi:hypothetical protein
MRINIRQSKPSYIRWNDYGIWQFAFPNSNFTSLLMEKEHNHGSHRRKWSPRTPQEDLHPVTTRGIDSIEPLEQVYMLFGGWLERVCSPQNTPMIWQFIIAIIKDCFEVHKPSHPQRKAYPLAQRIVPYQSNVSAQDLEVVGEGLWCSKP